MKEKIVPTEIWEKILECGEETELAQLLDLVVAEDVKQVFLKKFKEAEQEMSETEEYGKFQVHIRVESKFPQENVQKD